VGRDSEIAIDLTRDRRCAIITPAPRLSSKRCPEARDE
jgi:hypothetical protein